MDEKMQAILNALAANGIARARKLSATEWIIDGTGLT